MQLDPQAASNADIYRLMIRTILPRPIAWVSTVSASGAFNAAPFSFFTGVSTRPPTICFAPSRRPDTAVKKDTLANIEATREFVVNIATEPLAEAMNETATAFPSDADEFKMAGITPQPAECVRAPRIKESPVHFECRVYDILEIGQADNGGASLVIGEILLIDVDDRVLTEGKVDPAKLQPIGRLGGMEYARTTDRFVMPRKPYPPKS